MDDADEPGADIVDRRSPRSRGRLVLTLLGAALLVVGAIGLVCHFITLSRPILLGLVATSPYLALLGSVLGLAFLLAARNRVGAVIAVALLLVAVGMQWRLFVASPAAHNGRDLVVMTANLRLGQADPDDVVAAVRRDHVEVLAAQELTAEELARLHAAGLDDVLPHRVVAPRVGGGGTGLWSRYPLSATRQLYTFAFASVTARVAVPGVRNPPTALAVHMAGPWPDSGFWQRDMSRLPGLLRQQSGSGPVVVGGDFNATNDTAQFRDALVAGFHDAADQAGAGYTRTWPANRWYPPVIAIDHVLTRDATALSADTVSIRNTDHRALLAKVRLSP